MTNPNKWSDTEEQLLLELIAEGLSYLEVASYFQKKLNTTPKPNISLRSPEAIERKLRRIDKRKEQKLPTNNSASPWDKLKKARERHGDKSSFSDVGLVNSSSRKILSLSDIHFPLAREDHLRHALKEHADADIIVLNGDILDGYAASRFEKDKDIAAIEEYMAAFDFIEHCSKTFPKVILISGNHDVRTSSLLKKAPINQAALTVFETDLIARIANGERLNRQGQLVEKLNFKNVHYQEHESWWIKIGKTLFVHPHNRGSSKPGFTVDVWAKKFLERLPRGSFDSIVCGHTHKVSKHIAYSLLLIEQGCMADYMSYAWQPREIINGNSINGYAVIYQDKEGNTDFNRSNFVYCGQLLPANKLDFEVEND
jgi:predicted phosphodiesterase